MITQPNGICESKNYWAALVFLCFTILYFYKVIFYYHYSINLLFKRKLCLYRYEPNTIDFSDHSELE